MASEIRVNQIQSRTGVSTISFTETGPIISGVTTVIGNLDVTGLVSYDDVTNIDSVGVITARDGIVISEDNAIHFRETAADDADAILRASAGGGQLLINSRNDAIINIDSNNDSTDAHFAVAHGAATGSSTELFRVQEDGKIGVGTDNPARELVVHNDSADAHISIRSVDSQQAIILFGDNASDSIGQIRYDNTDNSLAFRVNTDERFRITSSGDIGIGDNAPNSSYGTNLSVHSTTTDGARIKISDGTSGKGNVDGLDIVHQSGIAYFIQRENNDMRFYTNSTERLRISNIGQLTTKGNNQGNPVGIEIRNDNTNAYSHAQLSLTSQNGTTSKIWCDVPNSGMRLNYNGGTSVKIDQSGNLVMANGAGIDFSDTANSQYVMSSELFDDYEEGTWTPTMGFANSYGTQSGKYVKVGKTVHIWFEVQVTAWSTYTGSTRITSSPFPIDKVTGCWAAVINATATTRDWRIGPWTAGGYGMAVWMENGQGSATSAGIRMSENTFSDYSSLTGSLGTNFTMKGGMTYISTT